MCVCVTCFSVLISTLTKLLQISYNNCDVLFVCVQKLVWRLIHTSVELSSDTKMGTCYAYSSRDKTITRQRVTFGDSTCDTTNNLQSNHVFNSISNEFRTNYVTLIRSSRRWCVVMSVPGWNPRWEWDDTDTKRGYSHIICLGNLLCKHWFIDVFVCGYIKVESTDSSEFLFMTSPNPLKQQRFMISCWVA